MSETVCRWGFLGSAAIARKNWKAIRVSGNGRVVAVASRSLDRARAFIQECEAEVPQLDPSRAPTTDAVEPVDAVEGYEALLARSDIDAVYIPLPTGVRKQWVLRAAAAGKHVLCEKPIAVNAQDAREMVDACASAGVQFMDGVMFDHSLRLAGVRDSLDSAQRFGELQRIQTHFSFCGDESFAHSNIRTRTDLEPHGCLGDLGWYCIRFTLWAMGDRLPTQVSGHTTRALRGDESSGDVPAAFRGEMSFEDGVTAGFYCSFLSSNQQTALLSGNRGYISLDDFVLPFYGAEAQWVESNHALEIDNCRWNFGRHDQPRAVAEYAAGEATSQEVRMVRDLATCALSGKLQPRYPDVALKTQQILDAMRRSDIAGGQIIDL